jgi:hypothetical protein
VQWESEVGNIYIRGEAAGNIAFSPDVHSFISKKIFSTSGEKWWTTGYSQGFPIVVPGEHHNINL